MALSLRLFSDLLVVVLPLACCFRGVGFLAQRPSCRTQGLPCLSGRVVLATMQGVDVVIGGTVAPEGVLRIVRDFVGLRMVQQPL